MKRTTATLAGILLGGALLTGCSGDGDGEAGGGTDTGSDTEAYCTQLEDARQSFETFEGGSPDAAALENAVDRIQQLAQQAPDQVADEWQTLDGAITRVTDALENAGVTFEDLEQIQGGQLPEGLDMQELQDLGTELQDLSSADVEAASQAIEEHAQDECGIDLSPDEGATESPN